jgi:hypothetical protein
MSKALQRKIYLQNRRERNRALVARLRSPEIQECQENLTQ